MLFVVVYEYLLPIENTKQYITLEKKAIQIYLEYGCLGVEIYRDAKDPRRWMELNRFNDREHYNKVTSAVNEDTRMNSLLEEFNLIFNEKEYRPEKKTYLKMI